jgi:hypothetical protein
VQESKRLIQTNMRLLGEVKKMQERIQQMGFVLTYITVTAKEPVVIPMDWTPPENFSGIDLQPEMDSQVLHIVPTYLPEIIEDDEGNEFEASPEFLAEQAAENEGM